MMMRRNMEVQNNHSLECTHTVRIVHIVVGSSMYVCTNDNLNRRGTALGAVTFRSTVLSPFKQSRSNCSLRHYDAFINPKLQYYEIYIEIIYLHVNKITYN